MTEFQLENEFNSDLKGSCKISSYLFDPRCSISFKLLIETQINRTSLNLFHILKFWRNPVLLNISVKKKRDISVHRIEFISL